MKFQRRLHVVAAVATTSVSFAELPAKPSVPAGTSDSSLTNSLQGSSTTSHHASVSAPSTTPAGYGLLAVVKQLHIRAPGDIDGISPLSGHQK